MRGVWRAWIAALGLGLTPVLIVATTGRPQSFTAGVLLTGVLAAIPGLAALKPTLEAEQFINGMRRSSGRVHIVEDELDWTLRRNLVLETPTGPWRVKGTVNPLRNGVVVKPPNARGTYHVRESPTEAGRVLMARVLTAQPAFDEQSPVSPEPRASSERRNTTLEQLR
jgi:hypothetical protein